MTTAMLVLSIEATVPRNVGNAAAAAAGFLAFGFAVVPGVAAVASGVGVGWTRFGSTPGGGSGWGMTGAGMGVFVSGTPGVGAGTPGVAGCCANVIDPTTRQAIKQFRKRPIKSLNLN